LPSSRSNTLLRALNRFAIAGLVGILSVVIVMQVYRHYIGFTEVADTMRSRHLQQQQEAAKREVQRVVQLINYRKSKLPELAGEKAALRVAGAVEMIHNMWRDPGDDPGKHQQIFDALSAIRFDQGVGYFFILDEQGNVLMHAAKPQLAGRSMLELRDSQGNLFIRELLSLTRQYGSGAIEYTYTKPGHEGNDFAKVSFVQRIPELGWTIGTGVYLDDLEKAEKTKLLEEIQQIRYGKNGYLFVNWNGVVLAHGAQPKLVGKNIWDYQDSQGIQVVQQLIAAARKPEGGFVHYRWHKPDSGEERPKVSFAMGIPEWQWMIGTGIYTDDVEAAIAELQQTLDHMLLNHVLGTLAGGLVVGLLLVLWLHRIYSWLQGDLGHFRDFFHRASSSAALLDETPLRYGEFRDQAGHVNRMIGDKLQAEQQLREQQSRLEQLVAERTSSLEEKTRELEQIANIDPLTGLLNRRSFSERAGRRLNELARYGGDCCLVLLDIDHFKSINDQHGHSVGDAILQTVGARLKQQLREVDLLGRWGGEEFTLLLPQTDQAGAEQMCQRMQDSLSGEPAGPVQCITASFGITVFREGDDLDTLVMRADQAMYEAKQAGRSRIESLL